MTKTTKAAVATTTGSPDRRRDELRRALDERRRALVTALHDKLKGRAEQGAGLGRGGLDEAEASDIDAQEDIELALLQMRSETLSRIDEAIARLEAGLYGYCHSCGAEIAGSRLRALPFAVRCRDCEELDEAERTRARTAQRRGSAPFLDPLGFRDPALS